MIKAATDDITKGWIYPAHRGYPPSDVQEFCVRSEAWQRIRLSMKGKPTHEKLKILQEYRLFWQERMNCGPDRLPDFAACQIDNYLGALRRGGQLDDQNMIRKYI